MIFRQHAATDFADMIIDQFDEMLRLSARYPLVCSIVLHPFIIGQPFRLRALRRALHHILSHREQIWLARSGDVARYVTGLPTDIVRQ